MNGLIPDRVRKMKKKIPFTGLCTAMVTPFSPDGARVDREALVRMTERQIDAGADALLFLGTTGEAPTVTDEERRKLLALAVKTVRGRLPVIAGCGSNDTARAVRLAKEAEEAGCSALLCVTPYYNKTTPEGLVRHFEAVADAADLPLILYNVPGRTGVDMPVEVCRRLSEHPRIAGIKEASGDIRKSARILAASGEGFAVWAGNDAEAVPVMALGGSGVISAASNLCPGAFRDLCRHMEAGDVRGAAAVQLTLLPLIDALFSAVNPIPVKTACGILGLCSPALRPPLCPMEDALRLRLEKELRRAAVCP